MSAVGEVAVASVVWSGVPKRCTACQAVSFLEAAGCLALLLELGNNIVTCSVNKWQNHFIWIGVCRNTLKVPMEHV